MADKDVLLKIYENMQKIRNFETMSEGWYVKGLLKEPNHSCQGQEAVDVGACAAIEKDDLAMPSLRSRGVFLSRGVDFYTTLQTQGVRQGSHSGGHETSHHSAYPEYGILAGTGMVGSSMALAMGAALGLKMKKSDRVVLNFFGDGASNRGDFHESLNMSAVWNLPCIFIIENNGIQLSANQDEYMKQGLDLAERAKGYGVPGFTIDGNDAEMVYDYTKEAVDRARRGEGPTLLNCLTMRMERHVSMASSVDYRPKEWLEPWKEKDPILVLGKRLVEKGYASEEQLTAIKEKIVADIEKAFEETQKLPMIEESSMFSCVYC